MTYWKAETSFAYKGLSNQNYGFSSSHVWMWELSHKKCLRTVVLEKTVEIPLNSKEIKHVNPKGNQSWIFIGRTNDEAEAPLFWPPKGKSWLIGKDTDAGKNWGQEEKGVTQDKTAGWHHRLNGHECEQTQRWWRTGKPDVIQSIGSQRVGHDWVTELNWLWLMWGDISLYFDLHFSNNEQWWASFHLVISHLYVFFGEMPL